MNNVNLIGRIGSDPDIKQAGENKVAKFSIALDGGKDKPPEWIDIETWKKQADFVENYLGKGRKIALTGRLKVDKWQDKDGNNRSKVKVVATFIEFADSKPDNARPVANNTTSSNEPSLDDIEF